MAGIGSMLGLSGGVNGTGISGPAQAQLQTPTTVDQANTAYGQNQTALTQQQQFLNAVQAQNGLGNQSSVFNQLQGVANGTGPNPAQAQLAQSTGANVANQAALMAGQRGSSANAGLIARQAAQQGANTQQQAAGQGATLQANQSLNALGQLGGLANTQAAQQAAATGAVTGANQAEQSNLLNSIAGQNSSQAASQASINSANAGLAGNAMTQQGNMMGGITGGIGAALGLAQGGQIKRAAGGFDGTNTVPASSGSYGAMPAGQDPFAAAPIAPGATAPIAPAAPQSPTAPAQSGPSSNVGKHLAGASSSAGAPPQTGTALVGNTIGKGIGAGLNALFSSSSKPASPTAPAANDYSASGFSNDQLQQESMRNDAVQAGGIPAEDPTGADQISNQGATADLSASQNDAGEVTAARGGKVPALVSPGEIRIKAKDVPKVAKGEKSPLDGEKIPGKPKVKGAKNSYANDTVPKTLNEGDIILPRSVTQSKHPHWAAHQFVSQIMAKNNGKLK